MNQSIPAIHLHVGQTLFAKNAMELDHVCVCPNIMVIHMQDADQNAYKIRNATDRKRVLIINVRIPVPVSAELMQVSTRRNKCNYV